MSNRIVELWATSECQAIDVPMKKKNGENENESQINFWNTAIQLFLDNFTRHSALDDTRCGNASHEIRVKFVTCLFRFDVFPRCQHHDRCTDTNEKGRLFRRWEMFSSKKKNTILVIAALLELDDDINVNFQCNCWLLDVLLAVLSLTQFNKKFLPHIRVTQQHENFTRTFGKRHFHFLD